MIDEERIKRSFSDQVAQLTAQNAALAQELNQRRIDDATSMIRGLETLAALAAAGNPAARQAVETLRNTLKQIDATLAGIVVVKS